MKTKNILTYLVISVFFLLLSVDSKKKKEKVDPKNKPPPKELKSRFITFKINKERWPEIDHFSRILGEFFINAGIKMQLVNMSDHELLGICEEGTKIDKEAILENFQGIIESVDLAN
jgi:hypothetical protein